MPPLPQLKQMMVQPKAALLDGVEPLSQMSVNTSYELQAKGASDEPLPPSERPEDSSSSVAAAEPHQTLNQEMLQDLLLQSGCCCLV